jgi:hypothetical protein
MSRRSGDVWAPFGTQAFRRPATIRSRFSGVYVDSIDKQDTLLSYVASRGNVAPQPEEIPAQQQLSPRQKSGRQDRRLLVAASGRRHLRGHFIFQFAVHCG